MNKIVVITGGTSGIGAELVKIYTAKSDTVCVLSKGADQTKPNHFTCDVTSPMQIKFAIDSIGQKFGRIDLLINCAGYGLAGAVELTKLEDAKKQFNTNFFGTFLVDKYAIKYMPQNATIINISSTCALFPLPYRAFYSASKSAVDMLSQSLSMELAPCKIKVVSVCPGDVKTNFSKNRVKNFDTNQRYGDSIKISLQKVEGNQEKRMSATYVAKKIVKIANKKSPKPMYIIGNKYKILYFLSKIFPRKMLLFFTKKLYR